MKKIVSIIIKLILLIFLLLSIYIFIPLPSDKLLYIPKDSDKYSKLAIELQKTPLNNFDFSIIKKLSKKRVTTGWIRLEPWVSKYTIYKKIKEKKREKTRVMIMYGGDTIDTFLHTVAKQANLDYKKLIDNYNKLVKMDEAGIIATKYNIPYNTTERSLIAHLAYRSYSIYDRLAKIYNSNADSKEFKKALIVASIIQKETQYIKEMYKISSVIYNRLNKNMKLQMDATLNYKQYSNRVVTPNIIRTDNSRYNTYKYKGLPPHPISSVNIYAINAALNPAKTKYLYFVKSGSRHKFSKKYIEHKKKVAKYKNRVYKYRKLINFIKNLNIRFVAPSPKIDIHL